MMSTPATISTRGEFQNSLLGEITEEKNTNSILSINSSISPVSSTRGESFDSLLWKANNASTTINSYHQNTKAESKISTRGESFDSLLGESYNVLTTTTKPRKQDSNSASKIRTPGESFDSLLGESLKNEASTTTSTSQPKSRSHESIEAIINKNNESLNLLLEDIETHEKRVKQVLERLKTNGLQIKLKKCELIKPTIKFLGNVISFGKVEKCRTSQDDAPIKRLHGSGQLL